MFLSDEAASEEDGGSYFIKPFLSEARRGGGGGGGGLMFLSEEVALQTDSSVSTAFRPIQGFEYESDAVTETQGTHPETVWRRRRRCSRRVLLLCRQTQRSPPTREPSLCFSMNQLMMNESS